MALQSPFFNNGKRDNDVRPEHPQRRRPGRRCLGARRAGRQ